MGRPPGQVVRRSLVLAMGLLAAVSFQVLRLRLPASKAAGRSDYVDARLCIRCHQQIAENYARTGMGRSFFRPAPDNTLETYPPRQDFYHAPSDTHFAMIRRDGQFFQRRWQIGFDGKEANVEELKVDFVMGSGNHARSYLHRTSRGTLIELPFGWYAEGGGRWGMAPGSDSDHPKTRRFISYKCMFCHNGIPEIPAGNEAPGSDPIYTGALPEGIDCQRCHGPGGAHLRVVAAGGSRPEDVRASIVNPARLSSDRRMEVCMQCHLETSSGRIPSRIVLFNRGPFSFVPGEPLASFMLTFDHAPATGHDEKFEAVSSVYRLRQSQCFLKSEGKLGCDTCHDPHTARRGAEAAVHYAAACRQCHSAIDSRVAAGTHTGSADCTRCHMPKRRAEDTPGMVMTDHRIQRRPPPGDLVAEMRERPPEEYHGEVVPYYPAPLASDSLYRAVAQVGLQNHLQAGLPVLAREVARQKPKEADFYLVLGEGWMRSGNASAAVAAYEQALRLDPRSTIASRALANALSADGQRQRAAETLQRALDLSPEDPITWYRYGLFEAESGNLSSGVEKIRKAIALDPALPEQSRSLAEVLAKAGQPEQAWIAMRDALRTDPYDDAAWDLAGRLLLDKSERAEAFYAFGKAIRLRPRYGPYLYDFALALVRADRFDEAQQRAQAAVEADANLAEAHELLGGLFTRKKQLPEAVREYRRVLELQPGSGRAHLRLASVLAAQGDRAGAVEHLREAARNGDAAIARQAADALRGMGER